LYFGNTDSYLDSLTELIGVDDDPNFVVLKHAVCN